MLSSLRIGKDSGRAGRVNSGMCVGSFGDSYIVNKLGCSTNGRWADPQSTDVAAAAAFARFVN
jgi:hypothetical protein